MIVIFPNLLFITFILLHDYQLFWLTSYGLLTLHMFKLYFNTLRSNKVRKKPKHEFKAMVINEIYLYTRIALLK